MSNNEIAIGYSIIGLIFFIGVWIYAAKHPGYNPYAPGEEDSKEQFMSGLSDYLMFSIMFGVFWPLVLSGLILYGIGRKLGSPLLNWFWNITHGK
jgi:hypothetical protein